jgi:hypothetical protein
MCGARFDLALADLRSGEFFSRAAGTGKAVVEEVRDEL